LLASGPKQGPLVDTNAQAISGLLCQGLNGLKIVPILSESGKVATEIVVKKSFSSGKTWTAMLSPRCSTIVYLPKRKSQQTKGDGTKLSLTLSQNGNLSFNFNEVQHLQFKKQSIESL
jgi:hypothetical protein